MLQLHFTYKIVNIINGKFYIGKHSTSNIEKVYLGSSIVLDYYITKYGKENFIMCDLEFFDTEEEAYIHEEKLLNEIWYDALSYDPFICYNIAGGGRGAGSGEKNSFYGKTHSEESKRKLSEAQSGEKNYWWGKTHSGETRRKISEAQSGKKNHMYGKSPSKETRRKISEAQKGKSLSKVTRRRMSEARFGEKNPNWGKSPSEKTRRRMSEAGKGRIFSEEHRRKISEALTGKKRSGETRRKISESHKGKTHSETTKRKISENSQKAKTVYQYNKETGDFIYEFLSCSKAAWDMVQNKNARFHIYKCVCGKQKSAYGFIWSYTKQENIFQLF